MIGGNKKREKERSQIEHGNHSSKPWSDFPETYQARTWVPRIWQTEGQEKEDHCTARSYGDVHHSLSLPLYCASALPWIKRGAEKGFSLLISGLFRPDEVYDTHSKTRSRYLLNIHWIELHLEATADLFFAHHGNSNTCEESTDGEENMLPRQLSSVTSTQTRLEAAQTPWLPFLHSPSITKLHH